MGEDRALGRTSQSSMVLARRRVAEAEARRWQDAGRHGRLQQAPICACLAAPLRVVACLARPCLSSSATNLSSPLLSACRQVQTPARCTSLPPSSSPSRSAPGPRPSSSPASASASAGAAASSRASALGTPTDSAALPSLSWLFSSVANCLGSPCGGERELLLHCPYSLFLFPPLRGAADAHLSSRKHLRRLPCRLPHRAPGRGVLRARRRLLRSSAPPPPSRRDDHIVAVLRALFPRALFRRIKPLSAVTAPRPPQCRRSTPRARPTS
ncbi:hypothetical protein FB451DRAFT_1447745 [Mycena latifolia]|nr:hypothetical protein FB451DRAFT_1447745 [Mycena latifolia]